MLVNTSFWSGMRMPYVCKDAFSRTITPDSSGSWTLKNEGANTTIIQPIDRNMTDQVICSNNAIE